VDELSVRAAVKPEDLTGHLPELRALASRLARSRVEAEDLVQETLLSAIKAFQSLRQPELAGAWLLRILRHKWYDVLREKHRERPAAPLRHSDPVADPEPADDSLKKALASLPPEERRILELRYFESRTSTEIAAQLGMTPGGVRSALFYALRRLEALCRPSYGEDNP
jgi:RNA polymerase sigma-70 factor (ECF subfamily)